MKIDIVTPYGNNKFDLGVNEVTALIQKAYEYSEKKSKEEPESEGIAETLQEAVAEAWGVVGDKERLLTHVPVTDSVLLKKSIELGCVLPAAYLSRRLSYCLR